MERDKGHARQSVATAQSARLLRVDFLDRLRMMRGTGLRVRPNKGLWVTNLDRHPDVMVSPTLILADGLSTPAPHYSIGPIGIVNFPVI